jgi:ribosomal protein S18 acetylase RimI-like enzyme
VAAATATQYSYQNALVAETEQGELVGGVVGYDGALLNVLRTGTWNVIKQHTSNVPTMTDETESGEFYLDSLAVMPNYRGHGVGEKLILKLTEKAFVEGHKKVGLIVDKDNPRAEALYTNIGFERVGEKDFLGHQMYHLQKSRTV